MKGQTMAKSGMFRRHRRFIFVSMLIIAFFYLLARPRVDEESRVFWAAFQDKIRQQQFSGRPVDINGRSAMLHTQPFLLKTLTPFEWDEVCVLITFEGSYSPIEVSLMNFMKSKGLNTEKYYFSSFLWAFDRVVFQDEEYVTAFVFIKGNDVSSLINIRHGDVGLLGKPFTIYGQFSDNKVCGRADEVKVYAAEYLPYPEVRPDGGIWNHATSYVLSVTEYQPVEK